MQLKESKFARGSALILTLVVVATLSALVLTTVISVNASAKNRAVVNRKTDAFILAQKGLALASHPQVKPDDPLLHYRSETGNKGYSVVVKKEAAKLNINSIAQKKDKHLLISLFSSWGLKSGEATELTDAMIDWVDANDLAELNGAETDWYSRVGFVNRPFNRPFQVLEEMRLVRGFKKLERVKPTWRSHFTLIGDSELDIHSVSAELLALASGVELSQAREFRSLIAGEDKTPSTPDDRKFERLSEAFDALGVRAEPEFRRGLYKRLRLNSSVYKITSKGWVDEQKFEISVIVRKTNSRLHLLQYREFVN